MAIEINCPAGGTWISARYLSQKEFRSRNYDPRDKSERASKQQKIGNEPGHDTLPTLRPPPRAPGFRSLLPRGEKGTKFGQRRFDQLKSVESHPHDLECRRSVALEFVTRAETQCDSMEGDAAVCNSKCLRFHDCEQTGGLV